MMRGIGNEGLISLASVVYVSLLTAWGTALRSEGGDFEDEKENEGRIAT